MTKIHTLKATHEEAEQALSGFVLRLPLLSKYASLSWDPYYGGWVGRMLSDTIDYCDSIITSATVPIEARLQAINIKAQYKEQLNRYNKSNFHFQFHPKSISEYEKTA